MTNQLPYNLLWRAIESGVLPACIDQQLGVLCYSPLAQVSRSYPPPRRRRRRPPVRWPLSAIHRSSCVVRPPRRCWPASTSTATRSLKAAVAPGSSPATRPTPPGTKGPGSKTSCSRLVRRRLATLATVRLERPTTMRRACTRATGQSDSCSMSALSRCFCATCGCSCAPQRLRALLRPLLTLLTLLPNAVKTGRWSTVRTVWPTIVNHSQWSTWRSAGCLPSQGSRACWSEPRPPHRPPGTPSSRPSHSKQYRPAPKPPRPSGSHPAPRSTSTASPPGYTATARSNPGVCL